MNSWDLVILFSGGADSIALLELAKEFGKNPYCILIDYQQLHIQELNVAQTYLERKSIAYQIVKIHHLGIDSGLTGDGVKDRFEGVHEMHVPSRNLMFVGVAASIAENADIDTIWYGADWSDFLNRFPDCMQEWFGRMNNVLEVNGPKPIKLEAPLSGWTKEDIITFLKNRGITDEDMFSGYGGL